MKAPMKPFEKKIIMGSEFRVRQVGGSAIWGPKCCVWGVGSVRARVRVAVVLMCVSEVNLPQSCVTCQTPTYTSTSLPPVTVTHATKNLSTLASFFYSVQEL